MKTVIRSVLRSPYLADGIALAYAAAYLSWVACHSAPTALNELIADAAFYPLGLALACLYTRNALISARLRLDRRTTVAWSLLASGALVLWTSGTAWAYFVRLTGPANTPGWIDGLEYLQLSLSIAAALAFPTLLPGPRVRLRFALDVALMLVAAGVLALHYGTSVIAPVANLAGIDLVVVRATLDWGVFFTLALGVVSKRDRTDRVVMACLLGANVAVLTGNWLLSGLGNYHAGNPIDVSWFLAWVLKWTAARYAWHQYRRGRTDRAAGERRERRAAGLPHAIVACAFGLLVYNVFTDPAGSASGFVYAAAGLAGLLVVRQVAELRENRRLFEDELALEARFRSLVQNSSDVVLVTDGTGLISYASPSVVRVLGEGAVTAGTRLRDVIPDDDMVPLTALFDGTPGACDRLQSQMRTAAGEWRDIEMVATDMRHDPAVAGIVLNCRDVTERNDLERQLHHAQKLDAVGHLAGGLAHDFNNVLTAIRGYTELLREDVPPSSPAANDLMFIEQAVDRAAAVTRKLLAFSRKQAVQRTVLDLNAVVVSLEPIMRQLVTDRVRVQTACDPGLWPVKADPGQMEQVIINLVTNARDAMPQGGTLRVATTNRAVAVSTLAHPAGDYAELAVTDTGTGIPDEVRARIFEPFFSTKPKDKGMGLGLAMVHGIVSQSGGSIAVDSTVGHGTTFTILLPRSAATPVAIPATPSSQDPKPGSHRILVVDDEPGVRTVVRRMLERSGYVVRDAAGGAEALALLATPDGDVDLLLTDLVMPGMHGRELIARFRRRFPGTPVVCMTGFAGEAADVRGPDLDIVTVITKPFSSDMLLRVVASAVARTPD